MLSDYDCSILTSLQMVANNLRHLLHDYHKMNALKHDEKYTSLCVYLQDGALWWNN